MIEEASGAGHLILGQITILEPEVALLPLTPGTFPVEVYVYALFVFFCDRLRFRMTLEPC